jgi:hypothetical protein
MNDASGVRLFRGISGLIESRFAGRVVNGYLTALYVAHRG